LKAHNTLAMIWRNSLATTSSWPPTLQILRGESAYVTRNRHRRQTRVG
jgi:hypothetical protein